MDVHHLRNRSSEGFLREICWLEIDTLTSARLHGRSNYFNNQPHFVDIESQKNRCNKSGLKVKESKARTVKWLYNPNWLSLVS